MEGCLPVNAAAGKLRVGAVASKHPLATDAGAAILSAGSNAFLLIRKAHTRAGPVLNGSDRAGSRTTIAHLPGLGHARIPSLGPLAPFAPGATRA